MMPEDNGAEKFGQRRAIRKGEGVGTRKVSTPTKPAWASRVAVALADPMWAGSR